MVIIETPIFTRKLKTLLLDDEYRKLQHELVLRPEAGDIIPGSGGVRKIRWAGSGRGKRGGVRVIYSMKEELFEELLESVKQGGAILRGEMKPGRSFEFDSPGVQAIRKQYGLSQEKFATLLGISVSTLRNWEQGRRRPEGPARVLLRVAARHPEAILDVV